MRWSYHTYSYYRGEEAVVTPSHVIVCRLSHDHANVQILRRLEREAARQGWNLPKVYTPLELMGEWNYESEESSHP